MCFQDIYKMINLDWLTEMSQVLPDKSNYQKSFFDIAGFPRWENVNSNLLAFYFDKEEEHNFSTLFIESLLKLIGENKGDSKIDYTSDYEVFRELRTDKGNYIDLVIKSKVEVDSDSSKEQVEEDQFSDWAIIIENKIDSWVHNDLEDYWNSVKATHKIGIVLSKRKEPLSKVEKLVGIEYHSITHKELIDNVQINLAQYFSSANDKHLILLKEYINNIENLYINSFMNQERKNSILEFQKHKEEIFNLKRVENNLLKNIYDVLFKVFDEFDFQPRSKKITEGGKHFFYNSKSDKSSSEKKYKGFRFWVTPTTIIYNGVFNALFELENSSNTIFGDEVLEMLPNNIYTSIVTKGTDGKTGGAFKHIFYIRFNVDFKNEDLDFYEFLREKLRTELFEHSSNFLGRAEQAFIEAKFKKQNSPQI
jgi:hypothetical protein